MIILVKHLEIQLLENNNKFEITFIINNIYYKIFIIKYYKLMNTINDEDILHIFTFLSFNDIIKLGKINKLFYKYVLNFINGKNYILQLDEIINNNTISKLSNFGLPKKDGTYGDLYISYNIENPSSLSINRKELLKKILPCRKPLDNTLSKIPLLTPELVPINLNDNISETDSEPDNPLEDLLNNPLQSLFNMTNLFG